MGYFPGVGAFEQLLYLAWGGGNLNTNFPKIQMPGGLPGEGGMLKLRFEWYINADFESKTLD